MQDTALQDTAAGNAALEARAAEAPNRWHPLVHAALAVGIVFAAAAIGSAATMPSIPGWYAGLQKPFFTPPNWVFGPAWSLLYTILAYAFWRILRLDPATPGRRAALAVFAVQLVLNALWSIVFFGMQSPGWGLLVVFALEASVIAMILRFRAIDPVAGWINVPYACWVAFATALNIGIVALN